jgi:hypothetical protein
MSILQKSTSHAQMDRRVRLSGSRCVERSDHSRTLNRLFSSSSLQCQSRGGAETTMHLPTRTLDRIIAHAGPDPVTPMSSVLRSHGVPPLPPPLAPLASGLLTVTCHVSPITYRLSPIAKMRCPRFSACFRRQCPPEYLYLLG